MPLPDDYLNYDKRGYGMDHDLYEWSMLPDRPAVRWPNGGKVALWVNVVLEHFPLDTAKTPFAPPGGLERPYPDYWNYTLRDYGNRVGCYRLFRMLDTLGAKVSVAMNAALAESTPFLAKDVADRGYEVIAHGRDMAHLHAAGLDPAVERDWIEHTLATLRERTKLPIRGWLSPGQSQSPNTPELLAQAGVEYCCDWSNDDMPYDFTGPAAGMLSMPYPFELSDYTCMNMWFQTAEEFAEQILDKTRLLLKETDKAGGRVMAVTLHPSISGQPYRVRAIREALEAIVAMPGVWTATPNDIAVAFKGQN
jgi:peptidoglycan/xylan/chitin deacetylase (PgdA/CDA1 family)